MLVQQKKKKGEAASGWWRLKGCIGPLHGPGADKVTNVRWEGQAALFRDHVEGNTAQQSTGGGSSRVSGLGSRIASRIA